MNAPYSKRTVRCQAVIFDKTREKILLVQHKNRNGNVYWWLPGGNLEPDEEPEECLRRELREELNINVSIDHSFELNNIIPKRIYERYITFVCTINDSDTPHVGKVDAHAVIGFGWFNINEQISGSVIHTEDIRIFLDEVFG